MSAVREDAGAEAGGQFEAGVVCRAIGSPRGQAADTKPPEGTNPDAGRQLLPPGTTAEAVSLGDKIFHGQQGATCVGCHGGNGGGSYLTSGKFMWSDGSVAGLTATITKVVPDPKQYRSPMPSMGGAQLSPEQVDAVAAYVCTPSHKRG